MVRDAQSGEITELRASYDPHSRGGGTCDGRKVRGTLHWVSARHGVPATVRLYDTLFSVEDPDAARYASQWTGTLNPNSLEERTQCWIEPALADATNGSTFQFERQGYFCVDGRAEDGRLVFNRTVGLRDSWAKIARGGG